MCLNKLDHLSAKHCPQILDLGKSDSVTCLITPVKRFIVQALRFQPLFLLLQKWKILLCLFEPCLHWQGFVSKKSLETVAMLAMASLDDTTTNGIALIEIVVYA